MEYTHSFATPFCHMTTFLKEIIFWPFIFCVAGLVYNLLKRKSLLQHYLLWFAKLWYIIVWKSGRENHYLIWSIVFGLILLTQVSWQLVLILQEEQVMYPSSLENENFVVAIVNCRRRSSTYGNNLNFANDPLSWEITRALKCEWCCIIFLTMAAV